MTLFKSFISPTCLTAALLVLPIAAHADEIDDLVRASMKKWQSPGISVAVIRHGKVIKMKGYGYANLEHRVKVTPDTMFEIGSIGKMFTASLVMKLVEDGKVDLEQSIRTYVPEAPQAWDKVTIRHLLTHTGGIVRDYPEQLDRRKDYTEAELLKLVGESPLESQPGENGVTATSAMTRWDTCAPRSAASFMGSDLLKDYSSQRA